MGDTPEVAFYAVQFVIGPLGIGRIQHPGNVAPGALHRQAIIIARWRWTQSWGSLVS